MNTEKMNLQEMREVVEAVKTGDKLKMVFDDCVTEDTKGNLYFILSMCAPIGSSIDIGEMALLTLQAVADSGRWEGCTSYTATVLEEFDPRHFISRVLHRELLMSIKASE